MLNWCWFRGFWATLVPCAKWAITDSNFLSDPVFIWIVYMHLYVQFWNVYLVKKLNEMSLCAVNDLVHPKIVYSFSFYSKPIWLFLLWNTRRNDQECISNKIEKESLSSSQKTWKMSFKLQHFSCVPQKRSSLVWSKWRQHFNFEWTFLLSIQKIWELLLFKGQSLWKITDRS